MKVFELLNNNVDEITEEQVANRMKNFDWKYEFSDDVSRITWGIREMQIIESMVYKFYKQKPESAVALWNNMSPMAPADKTVVPSFLIRMKDADK